jgi:spore germination cell wall hydrolase CwlJ-like protein
VSRLLSHLAAFAVIVPLLAGCAVLSPFSFLGPKECMARVMYFESNRSSAEGMLAVGTVVMNRLQSGKYPRSVCGVVGQSGQFAPGVLWLPMHEGRSLNLARSVADRVLRGERHPGVQRAMFFHTAGLHFPYTNMHYVLEAGGLAFYEKW